MKFISLLYILNAVLLLLHEMESAYEKEWEILKLPGKLTGFLLIHIPIIFVLFYGLLQIDDGNIFGLILGVVFGIGGILPLIVHRILIRRPGRFCRPVSSVIMYLNTFSGISLLIWSILFLTGR